MFVSKLIQYASDCPSYECFILRAVRLSCKLLGQGYVKERVKSSLRKFLDRFIYSDTLHWSDISLNRDLVTELDLITVFDVITLFREISLGHLQRVRLANRGRLLLMTPGPVPVGTYICSNVETILSWTRHVYGPFEFRTSLYPLATLRVKVLHSGRWRRFKCTRMKIVHKYNLFPRFDFICFLYKYY